MKASFLTMCLLSFTACPIFSAETESNARQADSLPSVAAANGRGEQVFSQSITDAHVARGMSIAIDEGVMSFSNSSTFRSPNGIRFGNTLNITVGRAMGSASTGHSRAAGNPNGVHAAGGSSANQSNATTGGSGPATRAFSNATQLANPISRIPFDLTMNALD
ncbi:MAG: hypothetical protein KDA59_09765 [Planctomycetales bacterium]|nr:hypothetical protein [Planctomycetales bacterium]MCA9203320.1 hypothetical protein [Planctomycetales bacterium]